MPKIKDRHNLFEHSCSSTQIMNLRKRPTVPDLPVILFSWNMQRGGGDGKLQVARDVLEKEYPQFFAVQEISQFAFGRLLSPLVQGKYNHIFCDAHVGVHGLGLALFVRKEYGGYLENQYALEGLANGRGVPVWYSEDRKRCLVGIHCLSGPDRNDYRSKHFRSLHKHFSRVFEAHVICGDLNSSDGFGEYAYTGGGKHLGGSILDGCLMACQPGANLPCMEYQTDGAGHIRGSDHPICVYMMIWSPEGEY